MLYSEFLDGTKQNDNQNMFYAYTIINKLYTDEKLNTKKDCYDFYKKNESCFLKDEIK